MARRLGASDAQVESVEKGNLDPALFTLAELAALRFAEGLTLHSTAIPDSMLDELRRHFDEGEVVEISLVVQQRARRGGHTVRATRGEEEGRVA